MLATSGVAPKAPTSSVAPTSSYLTFCQEKGPFLSKSFSNAEKERMLRQMWTVLSEAERAKWDHWGSALARRGSMPTAALVLPTPALTPGLTHATARAPSVAVPLAAQVAAGAPYVVSDSLPARWTASINGAPAASLPPGPPSSSADQSAARSNTGAIGGSQDVLPRRPWSSRFLPTLPLSWGEPSRHQLAASASVAGARALAPTAPTPSTAAVPPTAQAAISAQAVPQLADLSLLPPRTTSSMPPEVPAPRPPAPAPPPTKKPSSYHAFCNEQRPLLPAGLRNAERERALGQKWKALSVTERSYYQGETGYHVFCRQQRPLLPASMPNTEREMLVGQQWRALSLAERDRFRAIGRAHAPAPRPVVALAPTPASTSLTFQQAAAAAMTLKARTAGPAPDASATNYAPPPGALAGPPHAPAPLAPLGLQPFCTPSGDRDTAAAAWEDLQTQGNQWKPKRAKVSTGTAPAAAAPATVNAACVMPTTATATSTFVPTLSSNGIDEAVLAEVLEEMVGEEAVGVLASGDSSVPRPQLPSHPDMLSLLLSSLPPTSSPLIDELFEMHW